MFYPKVNDIHSAYLIRMETPEKQYLEMTVDRRPSTKDAEFVDRRSLFISDLVQFSELKEARVLRTELANNILSSAGKGGREIDAVVGS